MCEKFLRLNPRAHSKSPACLLLRIHEYAWSSKTDRRTGKQGSSLVPSLTRYKKLSLTNIHRGP